MRTHREGQRVPDVRIRVRDDDHWETWTTADLFAGRTVVVFSLPGAFTPTCSTSHVPRYERLAPLFRERGVDDIVCVSVNDSFVMNAWKAAQGVEQITFLPDGNGAFTEGMGMRVDKSDLGFGARSWRYSMLVRDGVIEKMFIEPDVEGDPFEVSDADTMLAYLDASAPRPHDVLLFTRPGCAHCSRAKARLDAAGIAFDEVPATLQRLGAVSRTATTPQIFIDGVHVGGADALDAWLERTQ